jgi:hypothetical protein
MILQKEREKTIPTFSFNQSAETKKKSAKLTEESSFVRKDCR